MNDITLVGIDTGGTFTDIVVLERGSNSNTMRHCKVLSDPTDPSRPIVEGLKQMGLENQKLQIIHGTTVGTNAVLEGKGARVAYITSKGFADVLTLGRQEREQVYQLRQPETEPPVPPDLCLEVSWRYRLAGTHCTNDVRPRRVQPVLCGCQYNRASSYASQGCDKV